MDIWYKFFMKSNIVSFFKEHVMGYFPTGGLQLVDYWNASRAVELSSCNHAIMSLQSDTRVNERLGKSNDN